MRSEEVDEAIKEGKDYIEFMTTAGDNAEWAETVLAYIEELEKENKFLRDENNIYRNETVGKKRIRDKIKELEEHLKDVDYHDIKDTAERNFYKKEYMQTFMQIQVLNSLLEGE